MEACFYRQIGASRFGLPDDGESGSGGEVDDVTGQGRELGLEGGDEGDRVRFEVLGAGGEEGGVVGVVVLRGGDVGEWAFRGIELSVES